MKKVFWALMILAIFLSLNWIHTSPAYADGEEAHAITRPGGATLLKNPTSTNMGGNYVSSDDPLSGNPATLARLKEVKIYASATGVNSEPIQLRGSHFRIAVPLGSKVGLMLGKDSVSTPRDGTLNSLAVNATEEDEVVGAGYAINDKLSVGINMALKADTRVDLSGPVTRNVPLIPVPIIFDTRVSYRSRICGGFGRIGIHYKASKKISLGVDDENYQTNVDWRADATNVFTGTITSLNNVTFTSNRFNLGGEWKDVLPNLDVRVGYKSMSFSSYNYSVSDSRIIWGAQIRPWKQGLAIQGSVLGPDQYTVGFTYNRDFSNSKGEKVGSLEIGFSFLQNPYLVELGGIPHYVNQGSVNVGLKF